LQTKFFGKYFFYLLVVIGQDLDSLAGKVVLAAFVVAAQEGRVQSGRQNSVSGFQTVPQTTICLEFLGLLEQGIQPFCWQHHRSWNKSLEM
jgi:hypothetical protein